MKSQGKFIAFKYCGVDGGLIALHQNTAINQIKVHPINLTHTTIHFSDIECKCLFFRSEFGNITEIRTVPEESVHRLTCYSIDWVYMESLA